MSFNSLLIDECDIYRNTPGAADNYGKPTASWGVHINDEPCRLMSTTGTEIIIGAEVVVANYKLFIGDLDITEQDRIVLDSITYEILLVNDKQDGVNSHHKELFLRTVR